MKEGLNFYYNGQYSVDFGLINCSVSSGLLEESFVASREIREVKIKGKDRPYFQEVIRSPLELSLTFGFVDTYDEEKIRAIARWLDIDYYAPFYTDDNPERIFYCLLVSDPQLMHNGLKQGYLTVKFRCNSPYSYSPYYTSQIYEWNDNPLTMTHQSFIEGHSDNMVIDNSNHLIINPTKRKWSDLSPTLKWNDL